MPQVPDAGGGLMAKLATELRGALRPFGMQEIGGILIDLAHRHRPETILGAFLDLMLKGARSGGVIKPAGETEEAALALLPHYAEAVQKNPPLTDLLAALYMAMVSHWQAQGMGQYFTPADLCEVMAEMNLWDFPPGKLEHRYTVHDPACGSGSMLLAAGRVVLRRGGNELLSYLSFTGVDLDPICAKMCAVQWIANSAMHDATPGEVVVWCGNSISQEMRELVFHGEHKRWMQQPLRQAS